MNAHSPAGARRPATGNALPTAWRVISDLHDQVDLQNDTIDGLRRGQIQLFDRLHACRRERDSLEATLIAVANERDAAIHVAEVNARSGGLYAAEAQRGERHLRIAEAAIVDLSKVIGRAYVCATGLGSIHDIATVLAPYVPEGVALGGQSEVDRLRERVETEKAVKCEFRAQRDEAVAETDRLKDSLAAVVLIAQDAPHGVADGHFERIITVAESHLPRPIADEVDPYPTETDSDPIALPAGFVEIDPATLPPAVVEAVIARTGPDARFYEVEASEVPRDVFRAIYGLAPASEPVKPFDEEDAFILETAEQYGFIESDEHDGFYGAAASEIIALVKAAREQGARDCAPLAGALGRASMVLRSIASGTPSPELVGSTLKLIDDALAGLTA